MNIPKLYNTSSFFMTHTMENKNPDGFHIKPSDKFFYGSPDSGDPDCICSRCGNKITEKESPTLRTTPGPGDFGSDPAAEGGTEFRFCWSCCDGMGIHFQ